MRFRKQLLCSWCFLAALSLGQEQTKSDVPSAPFRIAGVVVDSVTNQPLSRTRMSIAPVAQLDAARFVTADESGRFVFDHVAQGKYMLAAQHRGYVGGPYDEHDGYSTGIAVGPDLDPGELVFRLQPDCSITGKVTEEHGEPVREAELALFQDRPNEIPRFELRYRDATDDEGNFRFGHLRPGKYILQVVAEPWYRGYVANYRGYINYTPPRSTPPMSQPSPLDVLYPITYYPASSDPAGAVPIMLSPGDRFVADVSLQPVPARDLTLPLPLPRRDPDQQFVVEVRRQILGDDPAPLPGVTQVSQDSVEIKGLGPGQYEVRVRRVDANGENAVNAAPIDLQVTASGQIRTSQKTDGAAVVGKVRRDDGTPVSIGSLMLRNRKTGETIATEFSAKGEFAFQDPVSPGTYDLNASSAEDFLFQSLAATGAKATGSVLEIGDVASVTLTVTMTGGNGRVDGVALKDGKPFGGAMILLVPQDAAHNPSLFRRDQSDSDGTFTLNQALPGKYTALALENAWDLPLSDPKVLKPYLAGGTAVQVQNQRTLNIKVKVQTVAAAQ
ncbi:MAG TPA: carboxypeptidase-like regulatory domain-containing protein [Terriglobia bacterium]|nr:carboxypeptidase-like regulatory domain-containing protein [Terriglobia bacterium]